MRDCLVHFWYRRSALAYLAAPLALPVFCLQYLRRLAYRRGWLRSHRLCVPVVIVGNIVAGGTGKTPLVLWLVDALTRAGLKAGIVCRSYRASAKGSLAVVPAGDPRLHGDEAVVLARRTACPVWSGPDRVDTAQALLRGHPDVDVIVCDDGLQHYALARDCEIVVIDATRGLGNAMLLPIGPLREPAGRLDFVDAIVFNGSGREYTPNNCVPRFRMQMHGETFIQLGKPASTARAESFAGRRVAAIAGIGHPERFFDTLRAMGIRFAAHAFPDHHPYSAEELAAIDAEAILMTEKDAIKCEAFADARMWVLPVAATTDDALAELVLARIGELRNGKR